MERWGVQPGTVRLLAGVSFRAPEPADGAAGLPFTACCCCCFDERAAAARMAAGAVGGAAAGAFFVLATAALASAVADSLSRR